MYLTRLLYFSEATPGVDPDLENLLQTARTFNEKNEISGVLWFDGKYFIQILEGQREAVGRTYHRIAIDQRHQNIELVECLAISERLFPGWSMGYLAGGMKKNQEKIFRFSGHRDLRPKEMSPDSMLKFLLAMEFGKL